MTFRDRLADWISGGELSRLRKEMNWAWITAIGRSDALHRIAAMETPHSNATVRRMAKAAREAMKSPTPSASGASDDA